MAALAWLLDTNTLSDLIKNPQGSVARRLARVDPDSVCTSIVVACELRFGAQRKASPLLLSKVVVDCPACLCWRWTAPWIATTPTSV